MKLYLAIIYPLLVLVSCTNQNISQDKVPSVVLNAVREKFPDANQMEWEKHRELYEAEFNLIEKRDVTVQVDNSGKIIKYKHDIAHIALPETLLNRVRSQYKEHQIDDAELLEVNNTSYYQLELEGPGKDLRLVFTPEGNEVKDLSYWD